MAASPVKPKFDLVGVPVLVLVGAIVVMVNLISLRLFTRADLTENRVFTLADGTKNVLRDLDDIVKIEFYRSKGLPSRLATVVKGVEDYLAEYKAFGGKNIQVSFVDPDDSPDTVQQMRILGIPELQFNVIESDRQEVRKGYLGMAVFYADKKEIIQAIPSLEDFEYRLTSSIVKATQERIPSIGVWLGDPDPSAPSATLKPEMRYNWEKNFETLRRALQQQYSVEQIYFDQGKLVPDKYTTVIVMSPFKSTERDLYALDQFLMRGGNLVVFQEMNRRTEDQSRADIAPNPVASLMEHYGVRINADLVADERSQRAMFQMYGRRVLRNYPMWPRITQEGLLQGELVSRGVTDMTLFWTSSLSVGEPREGQVVKRLVQSSRRAMSLTLPALLTPEQPELLNFPEQEPKTMLVSVEGPFESYFRGKSIPPPMRLRGDLPPEPAGESPMVDLSHRSDSTEKGHLIVAGSAFWLTEEGLQMSQQNLGFIMNLVDSLEIGDKLAGVRMRDVGKRLITAELSEGQRSWLKFLGTFGAAFLVIGFAGARAAMRWRERREYAEAAAFMKKD